MLRITVIAVIAVSLAAGCGANLPHRRDAETPTPTARQAPHIDSSRITWFDGTLEQARAAAMRTERPLMIYVWTPWCGPCKRLVVTTFRDVGVITAVNEQVLSYSLDGETPDGQAFCDGLRINSYPTFVFFGADGVEIDRAFGFHGPQQLIRVVDDMLHDRNTVGDMTRNAANRPDDGPLRMKLGQQLALRGETERALEHLEAVLALDPADAAGLASRALFTIGRYVHRLKTRDDSAAARAYEALMERFPTSSYAVQGATDLATIYADRRLPEQALKTLERLVQAAPNDHARLLTAAMTAQRLKLEPAAAIGWAQKAAQARKDGYPWMILGQLYEQAGRAKAQIEALEEATRRSPHDARYRAALERAKAAR